MLENLNWFIIVLLSLPAILMGFLSLKGYTQNKELFLWLGLGALCIAYIFFYVHSHPFYHLFIIGLFWGILNSVIQSVYYTTYIAHNIKAANSYKKLAQSMNPRVAMVLIGIGTGTGIGIALGAVSWIAKKLLYNL
ncbi:MAG: hypothetical protein D8M58_00470 [Calditrichaeota bacterium]|nr:MAG: hypothetical protein DWQ03_06610 [Calditrichota bacterium]MBL1203844.1 hypothetical protein [Calditrichota bacterium]NOG43676.1 hypothetical protein [Calditrichota bacterium]